MMTIIIRNVRDACLLMQSLLDSQRTSGGGDDVHHRLALHISGEKGGDAETHVVPSDELVSMALLVRADDEDMDTCYGHELEEEEFGLSRRPLVSA